MLTNEHVNNEKFCIKQKIISNIKQIRTDNLANNVVKRTSLAHKANDEC